MNIFIGKGFMAAALTFVLLLGLAVLPLLAKERRGSTVEVTMTDGRTIRGELLVVKADALLVFDQGAGQGESIDLQQVAQVKVIKKSKVLLGFAIGLGIGFVMVASNADHHSHLSFKALPIPILIGTLIGAEVSAHWFDIAEAPSSTVPENLERLKRYAREQDAEKPAAN